MFYGEKSKAPTSWRVKLLNLECKPVTDQLSAREVKIGGGIIDHGNGIVLLELHREIERLRVSGSVRGIA